MSPHDPVRLAAGAAIIHTQRQRDRADPHSHEELMLFLPARGRVLFTLPEHGLTLPCGEHEAVCIRPGQVHAHEALEEQVEYLVAFLPPEALDHPRPLPADAPPAWRFPQSLLLREAASQLCACAHQSDPVTQAWARHCAALLALGARRGLQQRRQGQDPRHLVFSEGRLARAAAWAAQHALEAPSVEDMARAAGMSRRSLERSMKLHIQLTPRQYLEEIRLYEARDQLRAGLSSVTEVAFAVGYKDLSHFIRAFQALFGHSPTATRGLAPAR